MRALRPSRTPPPSPSSPSASRRRAVVGWVAGLAAAAVVTSLLVGHAHAGDRSAAEGTPAPRRTPEAVPSATTTPAPSPVTKLPVERVTLRRHQGTVVGDGRTHYVANGTEFHPGATEVDLPPRVRARSWVVADLETGRVLGRHRARARLPQASTLKLLTAVTAIRTIPAGTLHRVTSFETSQMCACAGLQRGRVYRRDTLLAGMLLPSGNDAAEAVAGSYPGGRTAFYAAMNQLARQLGARDTVAKNASGLTAEGSHSSALDLVVFLRAAVADDTISGILGERSARIATADGRHAHEVWRAAGYVNRFPGSLGKSGWTTPAQNTLVVSQDIGGHHLGLAVLGAPGGGFATNGTRALAEWASANFTGLLAAGRLPHP